VPRRNIVFLFADQMHAFAMGCMGTSDIHTPNLDRLAAEGILYRNCYSNAPVCTPFRVNLMTGRYGSQTDSLRNEAPIPAGTYTLADALNDGGYRTSYVGKWHIGDTGNQWVRPEFRGGFTEFFGYQGFNDFQGNIWFFDEDGEKHVREGHRTDVTTDIATERLEALAERTEPFALFVSYQNPHYPEQPSDEYYAAYADTTIQRRPNSQDIDPFTPTASPPSPRPFELDTDNQRYGGDLDEYLRCYYAMVTQLDANVGRLLGELDRLGLTDSTLVAFTSDHGDMQGSHGRKNKSVAYEESARIPLVMRAPGGATGQVVDGLVSGVDFYPTLLDWADLPARDGLEGKSIAPSLLGAVQGFSEPVFSEMKDWCMVRQGALKLVAKKPSDGESVQLTPTELFDLEADPYEMANLVSDPDRSDDLDTLLGVLSNWYRHVSRR
jgi:arylsulfatase A-like enzyme